MSVHMSFQSPTFAEWNLKKKTPYGCTCVQKVNMLGCYSNQKLPVNINS